MALHRALAAYSPILFLYDQKCPTRVSADISSFGLRAVLMQQHSDKQWRPVLYSYASRAITSLALNRDTSMLKWRRKPWQSPGPVKGFYTSYFLGLLFQTYFGIVESYNSEFSFKSIFLTSISAPHMHSWNLAVLEEDQRAQQHRKKFSKFIHHSQNCWRVCSSF